MDETAKQADRCPAHAPDPAFAFGLERRVHLRAYEHWRTLAGRRAMPLRDEFDLAALGPAAAHAVIIVLGPDGAARFAAIGATVGAESGLDRTLPAFTGLPADTLLGRLTDHLPAIIRARAPIGFAAEHAASGAMAMRHRGVLLPLADANGALAAVCGIITGVATARIDEAGDVAAAIGSALATAPRPRARSPWSADAAEPSPPPTLAQQLATARTWAALAATDHALGAAPLHAAIGAAHDALLLAGPADAVVARIFAGWARSERAAIAGAIAHARRLGLGRGGLLPLLARLPDGHRQLARAEREARRHARQGGRLAALPAPDPSFALMALDPDFLDLIGHRRRVSFAERRRAA